MCTNSKKFHSVADKNNAEKSSTEESSQNILIASTLQESIHSHAGAIAEDLVGYSGYRLNNDGGHIRYQKGHADIQRYAINPDYSSQNIKQQAGFNAEIIYTTKENKESILSGKNIRTVRTDDLKKPDGTTRVNDPVSDIVSLDKHGNIIPSSEGQMKFVNDPYTLCDKIAKGSGGGKNDLSRYQANNLILPSEQALDTKKYCQEQAQKLRKEAERIQNIKPDIAQEKNKQARQYEKLSNNIVDSGISRKQAEAYRLNPLLETSKSILNTAHDAGMQGAAFGAGIGSAISLVTNIIALKQGDKELSEALSDCTNKTAQAIALGYGTAFVGSTVKGGMEQAHGVLLQHSINKALAKLGENPSKILIEQTRESAIEEFSKSTTCKFALKANKLSKTNLPALAITICLELGTSIHKYVKGSIDTIEFMEELGQKGINITASSAMAGLGQLAIPIPFVGAFIGSIVGYTLSSLFYTEALNSFKGAKKARAELLLVEAHYKEAKRQRDIYRQELHKAFNTHILLEEEKISFSFYEIDKALEIGDMKTFASEINNIAEIFNKELEFKDRNEFDKALFSHSPLKL